MRYLVTVSCLSVLMSGIAFGQGDRGTIAGTVTDPSGAVVAGAKITPENLIYQTPRVRSGLQRSNRVIWQIFSDWQVCAVLRYQSGALMTAPTSNDNLGTYLAGASAQHMTMVHGQPLNIVDQNGKIDPTKQLILNPAAWTDCGSDRDIRLRRAPLWRCPPEAKPAGG